MALLPDLDEILIVLKNNSVKSFKLYWHKPEPTVHESKGIINVAIAEIGTLAYVC